MQRGIIAGIAFIATSTALVAAGAASAAAPGWMGWLNAGGPAVSSMVDPATASMAAAADPVSTVVKDISQTASSSGCLQYANHEYEVCTAYIFNASLADLAPYYTFVHSPNAGLSRFVAYRLGSRYTGQAYDLITNRTAGWPAGTMDVSVPDIDITSVRADLASNSATLTTQESWRVATVDGGVIYEENAAPHTITMERTPSYLLHKWVVTGIY